MAGFDKVPGQLQNIPPRACEDILSGCVSFGLDRYSESSNIAH